MMMMEAIPVPSSSFAFDVTLPGLSDVFDASGDVTCSSPPTERESYEGKINASALSLHLIVS